MMRYHLIIMIINVDHISLCVLTTTTGQGAGSDLDCVSSSSASHIYTMLGPPPPAIDQSLSRRRRRSSSSSYIIIPSIIIICYSLFFSLSRVESKKIGDSVSVRIKPQAKTARDKAPKTPQDLLAKLTGR